VRGGLLLVSLVAGLALAASAGDVQDAESTPTFVHGRWFDGSGFVERTVGTSDGRLVFVDHPPEAGSSPVVDLRGAYVIPPFCEGHNHNIGVGKPEERNARYRKAGVFYVLILNDAPQVAGAESEYWARSDTVDVAFAHGGITGRGGHPVELLEGIRKAGGYPPGTELADHAYFEIDSVDQLKRMWPTIKSFQPDIVKLFTQFSEEFEKRRDDPAFYGKRGLAPDVFLAAVDLAHHDGLRVAAHVTSSTDFHLAVSAGADVIAHLPGYMTPERIDPDDARAASVKNLTVITTAALAATLGKAELDAIQSAQKDNLRMLRDAGVKLVIGSDSWSDSSHREVAYLRSLGVFSDTEILRMWTANCAETVFPSRKIGRLEPGYQADSLALDGDPTKDFDATRRIALRVKSGRVID